MRKWIRDLPDEKRDRWNKERRETSFVLLCFQSAFPRRDTWQGKQETDRWSKVYWVKLIYSCLIIQVWVLGQKKSRLKAITENLWITSSCPDTSLLTWISSSLSEWSWNVAYMEVILNLHQKNKQTRKELKKSLTRCQHQKPPSDHPHKPCFTEEKNKSRKCAW